MVEPKTGSRKACPRGDGEDKDKKGVPDYVATRQRSVDFGEGNFEAARPPTPTRPAPGSHRCTAAAARFRSCIWARPQRDEKGSSPPRWRWVMLAILSVDICVSYIPYYSFVPIPRQSMQVYGVDEAALNVLCILYALVFVPGVFVTGPVVASLGCRWTFVLAMAINFLGCTLRQGPSLSSDLVLWWHAWQGTQAFMAPSLNASFPEALGAVSGDVLALTPGPVHSFWWLVVGQALCASALPFLVNSTSEMAAEWFPPHERPTAAMVSNLMNFIGSSLSYMLPPLLVKEVHGTLQEAEHEMAQLLRLQSWIALAAFVGTLALYRPAPRTFTMMHRVPGSCITDVVLCMRSRDFWLVSMYFSIYIAVCHAFDAVEGSLLEHYGYNASMTSWTGVSCAIASIVSTLLEAQCITSAASYRTALLVAAGFLAASQMLGFACLYFRMSGGVFIFAVGVMGLATPGFGCSIELGSEVGYPAREATVSSMLEAFSNLAGVLAIIATQRLIDWGCGAGVLAILSCLVLVSGAELLCLSGRLPRTEAEEAEEAEGKSVAEADMTPSAGEETAPLKKGAHEQEVPWWMRGGRRRACLLAFCALGIFLVFCRLLLFLPQSQLPEEFASDAPATVPLQSLEAFPAEALPLIAPGATTPLVAGGNGTANTSGKGRKKPMLHPRWRPIYNTTEPPNYIIHCPLRTKRLKRFGNQMKRAGLNFTLVTCATGTAQEVNEAVRDGLIGAGAAQATKGITVKGESRAALIGSAITHLGLMRQIAGGTAQVANVLEDQEILHWEFRKRRNDLLRRFGPNFDLVKLDARRPAGQRVDFVRASRWMGGNVFRISSTLSPTMNMGLGNYMVTKQGATKILRLAKNYDTFGRWESFEQYLMSKILKEMKAKKKKGFIGYTVQTSALSFNCQPGRNARLTMQQVEQCKTPG